MVRMARLGLAMAPTLSLKALTNFRLALQAGHERIYIIIATTPPPLGLCYLLNKIGHMGYRWIRLDPQGPKIGVASRISGPDQRGRRRQVPGGPEPGHPQESIFWESC